MYDELVKDLRENHDKYFARDMQAADVIEELSNEYEKLAEDFNDAVELLHKRGKPRWIPVTERLPGEFGRYLCRYRVEEGETIGYCTDFGRYDPEHGEWFVGTVTHWMPLPDAPKEGNA